MAQEQQEGGHNTQREREEEGNDERDREYHTGAYQFDRSNKGTRTHNNGTTKQKRTEPKQQDDETKRGYIEPKQRDDETKRGYVLNRIHNKIYYYSTIDHATYH